MSKPAPYDDLNTPMIAVVGVLACIIAFVLIAGAQALYYQFEDGESLRKRLSTSGDWAKSIQEPQSQRLQNYQWVDRDKKTVSIPIERAKELTIRDFSKVAQGERVPAR